MICLVIRRLYVHNFRCLENFELKLDGMPSVLLIGKNGSGKSAVGQVLEVLRSVGQGQNRISDLVQAKDLTLRQTDVPMRFEISAALKSWLFTYSVTLQLHQDGSGMVVRSEQLSVDEDPLFTREGDQINQADSAGHHGPAFSIDPQLLALPIIQAKWMRDPLFFFRTWLARIKIVRPMPDLIDGRSDTGTLWPDSQMSNFGSWFLELVGQQPAAYARMFEHLRQVMPDLVDIQNPEAGDRSHSMVVQFRADGRTFRLPFRELSSGEKCFMICGLLLASNEFFPSLCFWDEPDNYLALDEVQHFVMALRAEFHKNGGQFIATSHNPEVIRAFENSNTLVLQRRNHLEPTVVRRLSDLHVNGDLVDAITRGDLGE